MSSSFPKTSVPFPVLGDKGYVQPDQGAVLDGVKADINGAFGGNLNFTTQTGSPVNATPQAQLASSETAIIADSFALFGLFCNLIDPAYSSGRMQDAIGRIYFIFRIAGEPTVQPCLCTGLNTTIIPIGSLAQDQADNLWVCQQRGVIVNGSVTLNFACTINGPTPAPAALTIYQAIPGWDSVAPSGDAALGRYVETPAQFEARRAASTGLNSMGPLNSIYAAVAQLPGVLDVFAVANNTSSPQTIIGVSVPANAIFISVLGGSSADIGLAIFQHKMPGGPMAGNTTVTVPEPNPAYPAPPPEYQITYETPVITPFVVVVTLTNSAIVPANALTLVQNAIVSAFAGGDGGPRARIGSMVYASRYYAPVTALGTSYVGATGYVNLGWSAQIVEIQLAPRGNAATITGSIAGSSLTVTSTTGTLAAGDLLEGTIGGNGTAGPLTGSGAPLLIVSQISGSVGGTGVYLLNTGLTLASQPLTVTALGNDAQMTLAQAPGVAAPNIYVVLA